MSVTEIASALGEWSLSLKKNTPLEILNELGYFGHVAISGARVDPEMAGDELMKTARYVGVLRDRSFGDDNKSIKGAGMAFWLGDEDEKGYTIEEPVSFNAASFQTVMTTLLPPSIQVGTIHGVEGLYSGNHVFQSRRKAIDYVASLYDAEWRINGDGTFDAGEIEDLYVSEPKTAILRNRSGLELTYKALRGRTKLDADVKDFTTRVLLLAEGAEATTVSATADIDPAKNPYVDLFGNPLVLTRIVSEQQTSEGNAQARAQLQLNRFTSPREALSLSTAEYDIKGDVAAGDFVWLYDPETKLVDTNNPVDFHGQQIYPLKLRVFQLSWPIVKGMGVAFRSNVGKWIDLTDYVEWETGETNIVVGGYNRSLTGVGSSPQDPGSRPIENSTTPAPPEWTPPFAQSTYQSNSDGLTRAQVVLDWTQPLNTDGTVISDGGYYEVRYRTGETAIWPVTHEDLQEWRHEHLTGTFGSPIPFTLGAWQYIQVPWDQTQFLLLDLTPGIPYDFQVRAVDTGTPPNFSEWSELIIVQTRPDTQAPSTPAAPAEVAGSRNAIQIVHTLGRASGGTFNLEADLNHLQIHSGLSQTYSTDPRPIADGGTLIGKLAANQGMIRGQIPAVGTFPLDNDPSVPRWIKVVAVDNFGNESSASTPIQQTAELIDSAFISELTVSKVSAGEIRANWLLGAEIATATSGARVVLGWYGIDVFNMDNLKTLQVDSGTGDITLTGTVQSGIVGRRIVMSGETNEIEFYPELGETRKGSLFSYIPTNYPNDIAIEMTSIDSDTTDYYARMYLLPDIVGIGISPKGRGTFARTRFTADPGGSYIELWELTGAGTPTVTESGRGAFSLKDDGMALETHTGSGIRDGGFIWLDRPGNDPDNWVAMGRFSPDDDTIDNFISFETDRVEVRVDNMPGLRVRNPEESLNAFVEANRYCSFGEGPFFGQIQDASGTFSFRDDGGADITLDASGFSPRYVKNFVIDHPTDQDRWLVHSCTETPEVAVEYSGVVEVQDFSAEVILPEYFEAATEIEGRQVWLQVMLPDEGYHPYIPRAVASFPKDGRFRISTDAFNGCKISWKVKARRKDVPQFPVEPLKSEFERAGNGPYTWLEEK